MKRVLIVSPSFPPVSAADLHRVRGSLRHFEAFGWQPHVLAIDPSRHGGLLEPDLVETVPAHIPVTRTSAFSPSLTRLIGIGNPGLRAMGHLFTAGSRLLAAEPFDLVYFSTTMFPVMALGRLWRARYGVPYVLDLQDPWKTDYRGDGRVRGLKAGAARLMHGLLEPFTMRRVDGVVSVSPAYIETVRRRYPWIPQDRCAVIPFGVSPEDFVAARGLHWKNPFFDPGDGRINAVSVGRGGRDLRRAADLFFRAVSLLQARRAGTKPMKFWFAGTDYSSQASEQTIAPAAEFAGVGALVSESPQRLPYLQTLRLLQDASLTVILGSDDAAYSPSKVYPYLLTGKPFVAVLHADCPVISLLEGAGTGLVATFRDADDPAVAAGALADGLERLLGNLPPSTPMKSGLLEQVSARALTGRQCAMFDSILRRDAGEAVACAS